MLPSLNLIARRGGALGADISATAVASSFSAPQVPSTTRDGRDPITVTVDPLLEEVAQVGNLEFAVPQHLARINIVWPGPVVLRGSKLNCLGNARIVSQDDSLDIESLRATNAYLRARSNVDVRRVVEASYVAIVCTHGPLIARRIMAQEFARLAATRDHLEVSALYATQASVTASTGVRLGSVQGHLCDVTCTSTAHVTDSRDLQRRGVFIGRLNGSLGTVMASGSGGVDVGVQRVSVRGRSGPPGKLVTRGTGDVVLRILGRKEGLEDALRRPGSELPALPPRVRRLARASGRGKIDWDEAGKHWWGDGRDVADDAGGDDGADGTDGSEFELRAEGGGDARVVRGGARHGFGYDVR